MALHWFRFVQCWNSLKSKLNSTNLSSQIYITLKFPLLRSYFYRTLLSSEQIILGKCSLFWLKTEITQTPTNGEQTNTLTFFHLSTPSSLKLVTKDTHKNTANTGVLFNHNRDNVLVAEDFCLIWIIFCCS